MLLGQDTNELRVLAQELGEPAFRGNQMAEWLYKHGAQRFGDMTSLPDKLRARLGETCEVGYPQTAAVQQSRDGTCKLLLVMGDGLKVEAVGLPYEDRFSCCISTQVGCPVGCAFCATGLGGFARNLTAGEIVGQVLAVQAAGQGHRVDHVTFMGMGEPLFNYEPTLKAMRLLSAEMGIARRHLTISTAGYVPGIIKLAAEQTQATLAVSLHAATDELRRELVPGMAKWSVGEIIEACRRYLRETGRRVTFEYCLLGGVNDGEEQAKELSVVLKGLQCHVNLIPYNPVDEVPFRAPAPARVRAFRSILSKAGIKVTQRVQRGADIAAACGQLKRQAG